MSDDITVRNQLLARQGEDHPGLLSGDDSWSWDEVVQESCVRSAVMASGPSPPPVTR